MLGSLLQCWGQQGHVRPETLRARSHTRVTLRVAGAAGRRARLITRSIAEAPAPPQSRTDAEARVFKQLEQAVQAGRAPSRLLFLFGALYSNYQGMTACLSNRTPLRLSTCTQSHTQQSKASPAVCNPSAPAWQLQSACLDVLLPKGMLHFKTY